VRLFFMRDYDEEAAMLRALSEFLAGYEVLVTYNGKSYDAPLLETRFLLRRQPNPLPRYHLTCCTAPLAVEAASGKLPLINLESKSWAWSAGRSARELIALLASTCARAKPSNSCPCSTTTPWTSFRWPVSPKSCCRRSPRPKRPPCTTGRFAWLGPLAAALGRSRSGRRALPQGPPSRHGRRRTVRRFVGIGADRTQTRLPRAEARPALDLAACRNPYQAAP
jgi:hypothetical protein